VRGWLNHLVVFVAVNGLLVFVWLLTTGSVDELREVVSDPSMARELSFWPVVPIALWGTALVIHTGVTLSNGIFGFQAQRRRRRRRREIQKAFEKTARAASQMATSAIESKAERRSARRPSPEAGRRHWVAVMFTDIADSTPLTQELGDEVWRELLATHRAMVRACVDECGGTEVSTQGDSFFVRFDEVAAAVTCAVAIQRRLEEARDTEDFVPELRIGLHAGEAVADDDGDLLGHVVNLASRVNGAAEGGEILVTEVVADRAPDDVKIDDRGLVPLKGVAQPRHLLAVIWD
jgi:class 3 adenylate cyclase